MEADIEIKINTYNKDWSVPDKTVDLKTIKLSVDLDIYNLSNDSYAILETTIINMLKDVMLKNDEKRYCVYISTTIRTFNDVDRKINRSSVFQINTSTYIHRSVYDLKQRCTNFFYDIINSYNFSLAEIQDNFNEPDMYIPINHVVTRIQQLRPENRR